MKTRITLFALVVALAFPQMSAAMSYAMPSYQPIYFDAISLTGCPYPTSVSAFTGESFSTGVSYDTSDSYPTGYSYPTGTSYSTGESYRVGASYATGQSYATGHSNGPVGTSYSTGSSYATGHSTPTGTSYATGYSVPSGYSSATNRPKGTTYGAPNYAQYSYPNYYNESPTYMQDSTGYGYQSYYPQTANGNYSNYSQGAAAIGYNYINTAHYQYDDMTGVYYVSY